MSDTFPSRKDILDKKISDYQSSLIDEIKAIDIEKLDFTKGDFKPRTQITEKQKVFIWIRLFLKEEDKKCKPEDTIKIKYVESGEELETKFICYGKSGLQRDEQGVINYDGEDDRKVLCLMVDSERINGVDSKNIPYIRTLFKTGRYFEFQLSKRDELTFTNMRTKENIEYFDIDL